jgi:hypothetical protein
MATITNISPLGDLIIPALNNLVVKAGESAEVSEEAAASLLEQADNWTSSKGAKVAAPAPVDPTPPTSPADSIPAASN